ncbi:tRNA nucleotidyltransferase (CCA-adding enzyme) [Tamilnaduibacter salinus]|uniref:CCA-adding enzyme n=1 Tax=Tamilnaduibacter salinus TaxID=1484056 RepID=A0A2A2I5M5_9GAMM|nr:multifunctional CCA tRNA nucleotidyl transferase/2'3'-cyclic phosphodiesterase/2'nucleotidase/phosphatase [Tamilnaduibacter salinus]PAV26584.1 multifunctional CCA tRNA nucleotidyl transferase/2'3'-cyclic phosphodiesterase/2'nucleotidase/phosphatase [Tamilnaduibacter salinus]PVY75873.1 tRNA nucleotidyltransferase (CCA-adding enzyme) [Tamilnaduibacter salinus]
MHTYLVGGAVRDALLGRPVTDRDWVVVGATPQEMETQGFRPVGADFPVFLHPDTHEEYALARTERKQGHGYHGFTIHSEPDVTLEEDLRRRDLTINAMAQDTDGTVIDPFGGQQDLADRCLRHVSPAFEEDPLRILRTARFAARFHPLGFRVADNTQRLMASMVTSGEVDHLVPERIWQETRRALHEKAPDVYFRVLHHCGALARIIPSLARALDDTRQPLALQALLAAADRSDDTAVRLAALLAPTDDAEALTARVDQLRAPNDCRDLTGLVARHRDLLTGTNDLTADALQRLMDSCDAWRRPERFEGLLTAADAIATAMGRTSPVAVIRDASARARQVDPQTLMAEGYRGAELGKAISREKRRRIEQALAER